MPIELTAIRYARQTDLHGFLTSRGEKFKKSGKRWQHIEHDSLIISGNMFYWNSRQANGNSLDFVMLYYGWTFEQAIQELTGFGKAVEQQKPQQQEIENPKLPRINIEDGKDRRRVIAYLGKTRGINSSIVKRIIDDGYITQDEKGNAVFKVYNEHKELVGAEVVGTLSQVRFKKIAEGSQAGYGFNVTIGEPTRTLFFESSIDLLSFWTLHEDKLTAHRLVSLSGLRIDILRNMLKKFQVVNAYLCVDTDDAGKAFIKVVKDTYQNIKVYLPKIGKDWNDQLSTRYEREREAGQGKKNERGCCSHRKLVEAVGGLGAKKWAALFETLTTELRNGF